MPARGVPRSGALTILFRARSAFKPDGVIMFSDILTPLTGLGVPFDILEKEGPVVSTPIRSLEAVRGMRPLVPAEAVPYAGAALSALRAELAGRHCHVTTVCPGPVASGAPGQPRVTFGATLAGSHLGAAGTTQTSPADGTADPGDAKARLPLQRCAALTLAAAGHGVREAWLARHPVLLLLYITQMAPSLGAAIIDKVGPKRVAAARSGGNMYAAR
jgi:hypothetical protein